MIFKAALGPALNARDVISSLPETAAVIDRAWLVVVEMIVIKKSMYLAPLIVFDADAFAVTKPVTRPLNDAVTANAFAEAAGLLIGTRRTNVVPAIYVPLPLCVSTPEIVSIACALIAMAMLLVCGPNARPEISSVPVTVVMIVTAGWLAAFVSIVTIKSM